MSAPEYTTSGSKGKKTITWQENKGTVDAPKWENIDSAPSEVGNYRVVVTLAEDNNYKSAEAALKFVISKAENVWTEELSIEGWTYGSYDETKMFQVQKRNSETLYLHTAINKTEHTKTKRRKMQEHGMSRRL